MPHNVKCDLNLNYTGDTLQGGNTLLTISTKCAYTEAITKRHKKKQNATKTFLKSFLGESIRITVPSRSHPCDM